MPLHLKTVDGDLALITEPSLLRRWHDYRMQNIMQPFWKSCQIVQKINLKKKKKNCPDGHITSYFDTFNNRKITNN